MKKNIIKYENQIPITWNVPEGIATPFATNILVQIIENEFKLIFFELKPPIITEPSQSFPKKVNADYVGGVIISADRLPKFIKALQKQLDQYYAKQNNNENLLNGDES